MTTATMDRRVRKTRQQLFDALLELILEKGYDKITVQDLIDRADVGRSTFYAHYRDKEELLVSGFDELKDAFEVSGDESPSLVVFRHASQFRDIYKVMAGKRGGQVVIRHLNRLLTELYTTSFEARMPRGRRPEVPVDVAVSFLVNALIGTLQWCLDRDEASTPEQLHAWFLGLANPGIRGALGVDIP